MAEHKNLLISFIIVAILVGLIVTGTHFWDQRQARQNLATQISQKEWLNGVKALIPSTLCPSFGYFLNCFSMPERECRQRAIEVSQKCVDTVAIEMPETLNLPEDGRRWGFRLASCVERSLEFQVRERKKATEDCETASLFWEIHPPPTVLKAQFMLGLEAELPSRLCEKDSFFRTCFLTDEEACLTPATEIVSRCIYDMEPHIPAILQQPVDSSFWGARIGGCAGQKLEEKLAPLSLPNCRWHNQSLEKEEI